MRKILFLTYRLPFPAYSGDKIRSSNFIKHLSKRNEVTIVSFYDTKEELLEMQKHSIYYKNLIAIKRSKMTSYLNTILAFWGNKPLQLGYYFSLKYKKAVTQEMQNTKYNVIFSHIVRTAQYVPVEDNLFKIIDLTDALSLNYKRSASYVKGLKKIFYLLESKRIWRYERNCINNFDLSILISNEDANFLTKGEFNSKVMVIPNGVDFIKYEYKVKSFIENKIVFVGTMHYLPNIDAVLYFVNSILPIIQSKIGNVKFYIVGAKPSSEILKLHNGKDIFVTGFVESTVCYFQDADIFVAPFRIASGLQNKILESLAVGTPVITTNIGAEGLDPKYLLIGNNPDEFAEKIFYLLENKDVMDTYAINGRKYIEESFNWNNNLEKLHPILEKLK